MQIQVDHDLETRVRPKNMSNFATQFNFKPAALPKSEGRDFFMSAKKEVEVITRAGKEESC